MTTTYTVESMRRAPEGYAWSRFGQPEYTDWLDESLSWKQTCYVGDWSFLWQHRFTGRDALQLLGDFSVNTMDTFAIGRSKHAIHTDENGKIIHEGILTRFGEQDFVVHGRGGFWLRHNAGQGGYEVDVAQEDWFILQVSGPAALEVLHALDPSTDLLDTKYMWVTPMTIAGYPVHALRQGMAGEVGFELQGPGEAKAEVYAAILAAGEPHGIRKMGARVAMINHLEASYPTIATDYIPAIFGKPDYLDFFMSSMPSFALPAYIAGSFESDRVEDYYRSPVELGWGRVINPDHDFLGKEALMAELESPQRVLRTLEWNTEDVADVLASVVRDEHPFTFMELPREQRGFMWADRIERDGRWCGVATSRGYSHWFRRTLSLAVVDVADAEVGTDVEVVWGNPGDPQKRIRAKVAPTPYKTPRSRGDLRSSAAGS